MLDRNERKLSLNDSQVLRQCHKLKRVRQRNDYISRCLRRGCVGGGGGGGGAFV